MKKIAFITGSTQSIGFETAKLLGQKGYTVLINGLIDSDGEKAIAELESLNIECEFYKCDVTIEEDVIRVVNQIGEKYGHIDTLIHGAGGLGGREKVETMTTDFYKKVLALNLDSVFYVTRAAIPFLKKSENHPSIITFTSIAAYNGGGPGVSVYSLAKAAVLTLTRSLAKELIEYGIRVNSVSPGVVDTPFHKDTNRELLESWKTGIPAKRFAEASEIAELVEFLVSDKSLYIVGEAIQINGGQMFQ